MFVILQTFYIMFSQLSILKNGFNRRMHLLLLLTFDQMYQETYSFDKKKKKSAFVGHAFDNDQVLATLYYFAGDSEPWDPENVFLNLVELRSYL